MQSFVTLYGRIPRLPIDLIFRNETLFTIDLEPDEYVREKDNAMKKVFEFVATIREGNIQRQEFFHDPNVHGKKFKLLDRVYLKNDQPRVGMSKKLKFKYDGVYMVIAIMELRDGDQINEQYRIKPEGRGKTKVVNVSKLKKTLGPYCREKIEQKNDRLIDILKRASNEL